MIETSKTAVTNKDRNIASTNEEDDDAQETCGNDEEAGPNDEGDSNVASNTIHDNKVVTSSDNGGIIRVREDDSNATTIVQVVGMRRQPGMRTMTVMAKFLPLWEFYQFQKIARTA
jgi:hypothetical protein